MPSKREYNLDFLRILACFMVVLLHTSAQNWGILPFSTLKGQAFNVYSSMVRSAVSVFFMLSGKLFLSKENLSIKRLFLKNILKLLFVYTLWSLLYAVDRLGLVYLLNNFNLREFASAVIASKYHLWYLPELISIYFMLPVLFALKNYQDGKVLSYICVMVFFFTIVRVNVFVFLDSTLLKELFSRFSFSLGSCCGFFVLGYVLDKYKNLFRKIETPVLLFWFFGLVALTTVCTYLDSLTKGSPSQVFYNDLFITNYLEAIVLFLLFLRLSTGHISERAGTWLQKLSKYTLFVYLVHPFVLEHLKSHFLLDTFSFTPWLSIPFIAAIAFLISVCTARIIDLLPGLRHILL